MFKCIPKLLPRARVTEKQAALLLFLLDNKVLLYRKWPAEMQNRKIIASLARRNYLSKKPHLLGAYALTRSGYSMACWIKDIHESKDAAQGRSYGGSATA
jgi:hypothetical protein